MEWCAFCLKTWLAKVIAFFMFFVIYENKIERVSDDSTVFKIYFSII